MSTNITTEIWDTMKDKRETADTRAQATKLSEIVGTNKKVPNVLKNKILDNPSKGEAVNQMKIYVKSK